LFIVFKKELNIYILFRLCLDKNLKLKAELFEEIKPGLSAYADKPADAAKSLEVLLTKARAFIPKEEWSSTPISLKATAGLRLLPKEKAENILNEVRILTLYLFSVN